MKVQDDDSGDPGATRAEYRYDGQHRVPPGRGRGPSAIPPPDSPAKTVVGCAASVCCTRVGSDDRCGGSGRPSGELASALAAQGGPACAASAAHPTRYTRTWQVIEERQADDVSTANKENVATTARCQYVWDRRYIHAPVLRDRDTDADGECDDERLFYLTDANFNVVAVTDASAAVVERYEYDPYGKVTIYNSDWSATVPWENSRKNEILYCGYRFDPETGLYHVRHRMYHPTLGRWITRDPRNADRVGGGYHDGMTVYQYVRGNTMSSVDPSGTMSNESCNSVVKIAFTKTAKGRTLMAKLKEKPCPIPMVTCKDCCKKEKERRAWFSPTTKNITICQNVMKNGKMLIEAVVHELVHAWDDCGGSKWSCDERACSEIRATNIAGLCATGTAWRNPRESYNECVKRLAAQSTSSSDPKCGDGKAHVEKMWDQCRNDVSPVR